MSIGPLLLGDPSPSLRWRVARELEGADDNDAEVVAWRAEIDRSTEIEGLTAELAAAADQPSTAAYLLCRLAHLGYRGPAAATAVEHLFSLQQPNGSWSPPPSLRAGSDPGSSDGPRFVTMQTVVPLRGIAAAGFATDPRAERAYEWLLAVRLVDGSWPSGPKADLGLAGHPAPPEKAYRRLPQGLGCRSATTGAAACLALHPDRCHSEAARTGVSHLLARESRDTSTVGWEISRLLGLEPAMGQVTFYATTDPAFLLELASSCGFNTQDPLVETLATHLESLRGPYGLWEHPTHPQLSAWLSLNLESTLRHLEPT
ncbi:hypothetical protein [Kribbella sp. NPDC004875]|uniref:hypothetical protein n=1 Tax=Kribbella sp. NPDC004875 TaxID=3364107 RepID=UPI003678172D